jgi:hypothetical protein
MMRQLSRASSWPQALSLVDQDTYGRGWEIGAYAYTGPYPLQITSVHGSVIKSPDQMTYAHGETVTLQALPDSGCLFAGWSGDLNGSTNPVSLVMDGHKAITAYFGIYTLSVSGTASGSVTRSSDKPIYGPAETVTLQAVADVIILYRLVWRPDWSSNPATVVDGNKSIVALRNLPCCSPLLPAAGL